LSVKKHFTGKFKVFSDLGVRIFHAGEHCVPFSEMEYTHPENKNVHGGE